MKGMDLASFLGEFREEASGRGWVEEELMTTGAGPLLAFEREGEREGAPVYLSSGIHGDEPAGPHAMLAALRGGVFDDGRHWLCCPALNPTGLAAGTRENAEGEDLNRDYFQRRTAEVRAHAAWLESRACPAVFVSLHEDWESRGFYFYEINLEEDVPERAEAILRGAEAWLPRESSARIDGHEVRAPGWIYHRADADLPGHWPEAIFMAKRGCPLSFTFETPSSGDLHSRLAAHLAALRVVLQA
jgi:protein MpaA